MAKASQTVLEIDLEALAHNYQRLRSRLAADTMVLGVVKASGYGSESIAIARKLEALGADYLAVAYAGEGVALRDAGVQLPIMVLHPQPVNFGRLMERCLEPALYSFRVLTAFIGRAEELGQKEYPVHINFNTGLNRLGFNASDTPGIATLLDKTPAIKVKSLFSHLAASEDPKEKDFTLRQIGSFKGIAAHMEQLLGYMPLLHQSNTSAVLNYPEAHFDMVRMGIGLYGYSNSMQVDRELVPVATLKSVISQIHDIPVGETVGYNRAFKAKNHTRTATIPIGHADGIPRALGSGKGQVLIRGKAAPIVGNVCMDMIMVDVTGIDCSEGDEVVVFGPSFPATEMAARAQTISYETLTAISGRIERVILNDSVA